MKKIKIKYILIYKRIRERKKSLSNVCEEIHFEINVKWWNKKKRWIRRGLWFIKIYVYKIAIEILAYFVPSDERLYLAFFFHMK